MEVGGGVVVHPTYVDDVVHAILALVAEPAPHGTVFNVGGERALRLQELQALQAEILGVSRRRIVVPPRLAGPVSLVAGRLLAGRAAEPPLAAMLRGELFSAAVDDRKFRSRYASVPVTPLRTGLAETIDWAIGHGLL